MSGCDCSAYDGDHAPSCAIYVQPAPRRSVEAVLGMAMLDPEDDGPSAEWCAGYNACLAVVRSYLPAGG